MQGIIWPRCPQPSTFGTSQYVADQIWQPRLKVKRFLLEEGIALICGTRTDVSLPPSNLRPIQSKKCKIAIMFYQILTFRHSKLLKIFLHSYDLWQNGRFGRFFEMYYDYKSSSVVNWWDRELDTVSLPSSINGRDTDAAETDHQPLLTAFPNQQLSLYLQWIQAWWRDSLPFFAYWPIRLQSIFLPSLPLFSPVLWCFWKKLKLWVDATVVVSSKISATYLYANRLIWSTLQVKPSH